MDKLEIDLGSIYIAEDSASLQEEIVNRAALKLLQSRDVAKMVRDRIEAMLDEEILRLLEPMLEEAFAQALQPTDSFGAAKGPPVTLREWIIARTEKWLREETGDYRNRQTRVEDFVSKEVERYVRSELSEAMKEATARVRAAVEQQGAEVLQQTIARMAR